MKMMMYILRKIPVLFLVLGLGVLAACEDSETAAERYYQSALTLLEEGDTDRALVELRNVFDNNGRHKEARRLYADIQRERGNFREAYGQYLRLVEQYPDTPDARRILAEMALDSGDWEEVERHANAAIDLEPESPGNRALAIALDFRDALLAGDDPAAAAAADAARDILEADPALNVARRVVIDWIMQGPDPERALPHIDLALEQEPGSRGLHMTRLSVLSRQEDKDATGAQLQRMYELFPQDEQIAEYLIGWYMSNEDFDAAEAFLRDQAGADDAAPEGHMNVVQLIGQQRGVEAAITELDRLAAANEGTDLGRLYASEAASLRFGTGAREDAIAEIEAVIEGAESVTRRLDAKMILARMRAATGDREAMRVLVDEILEEDPRYVEALKIRAAARTRENDFGDAVGDLRAALDQDPTDSEALLMLADVQQKAGNLELAQQQMAQAVEVSNAAPRPSLVYARFLASQDRLPAAEIVLSNAFAANETDLDVAAALARILLQRDRLAEASQLADRIDEIDAPRADQMVQGLRASILFRQNRVDESLTFLQSQIGDDVTDGSDLAASLQLLRLQILSNRMVEARATIEKLAERFPDSVAIRILLADLSASEGAAEDAVAQYRAILEDAPDAVPVIERLYRVLIRQGDTDAAEVLVRESLQVAPEARSLRLIEAGRLEREDDIAGAIAIYEEMYDDNPDDLIAANNLASLLSLHRDDPADLDRAFEISLRLTGARQPAFQDTLGWIQLQRGDVDAAVQNLQAAARGLPNEPTVAFNLGLALAEAGREDEARAELERGLALAGEQSVAQIDRARERLAQLNTADP